MDSAMKAQKGSLTSETNKELHTPATLPYIKHRFFAIFIEQRTEWATESIWV
jgi:hypothetical protein